MTGTTEQSTGGNGGSSNTIAAIERAADVLLFMADAEGPTVGVTEIAGGLGMSKAVVHRIVTSLRDRGFVELDEDVRRYRLGPAALTIGAAYLDNLDIRSLAQAPMRRLVDATDETATLSIRDGWTRIYIDQVTPEREVKMSVRLGVPFPLHAGGSSKAFLAFLQDAEIDHYLGQPKLDRLTNLTLNDPAAIRAEIEEIRRRGYASSLGERQAGAASVAAPVRDRRGRPIAVLSVSGPVERFGDRISDVGQLLVEETRALSRMMGWRDD